MDKLESNLLLLENVSKQISDLIHNNNFQKIPELDELRKSIIENIHSNKINELDIKSKLMNLIQENESLILISEIK